MDQARRVKRKKSKAKRRKLNNDQNKVFVVFYAADQQPDIFKLNIDCFEEIFDYLPFESLVNFSQTCTRFQQVAVHIYQQNYSDTLVKLNSDQVKHFMQFVQKIELKFDNDLWNFVSYQYQMSRLTQIEFTYRIQMTHAKIASIKKFLKKILYLHVGARIDTANFETLLDACPKIERIDIDTFGFMGGIPLRKWSTLKKFGFYSNIWGRTSSYCNTHGLATFLELNQNIRHFATDILYMWNNGKQMKCANIKLDDLGIRIFEKDLRILKSAVQLLIELYELGFYKRIHLYCLAIMQQDMLSLLVPIKGVVKFYFGADFIDSSLSVLNQSEELHLVNCRGMGLNYFTPLPINFTHLKRLTLEVAVFDDILRLVSQAELLVKINVTEIRDEDDFNLDEAKEPEKILDLHLLNRARTKLANGRDLKVTIFAAEKLYLATKWAMKGNDFGLIRMRRAEFDKNDEYFVFKNQDFY